MYICHLCHEGHVAAGPRCVRCGAETHQAPLRSAAELTGMVIDGRYEIEHLMQEGGMGWVFRARHLRLQSPVAIKLMKPAAADLAGIRVRRFEHEARTASRLYHPHIVSVIDFGRTPGGLLYLVSELVRGVTLAQALSVSGPMPLPRVLSLFSQILGGVEAAHRAGVVHRDLKPDNIMVSRLPSDEEFVKILDFGIARSTGLSGRRMTLQGEICGTPAYMAPEQARGETATPSSDVYACGVLLFEMLSGQVPFEGISAEETLDMQKHHEPPALGDLLPADRLVPGLEEVVRRALAKSPSDRYRTIADLRQALFCLLSPGQVAGILCCTACHRPPGSLLGPCAPSCAAHPAGPLTDAVEVEGSGSARPRPEPLIPARVMGEIQTRPTLDGPTLAEAIWQQAARIGNGSRGRGGPIAGSSRTARLSVQGRERELARLGEFLSDRTLTSLEISGVGGLGKSLLLQQLEAMARARGMAVQRAGSDPHLARRPWHAARQLVGQVLGLPFTLPDLTTLRRVSQQAGLLPRDLAGLTDLFSLSMPVPWTDATTRVREMVCSALRVLLGDPGSTREEGDGTLYIVDNAEELDGGSLHLLRSLCDASAEVPIKVALASAVPLLAGRGAHLALHLDPLPPDAARALLQDLLPSSPVLDLASQEAVLQAARGIPLHLLQAARLWREGGCQQELQGSLPEVIRRRLDRLAPPDLHVLQAMAVVGRCVSLELLGRLLPNGPDLSLVGGELVATGLVQLQPDEQLAISHLIVAEVALQGMSLAERRDLHRRLLEMLEVQGEAAAVLARHAFEAGLGERSLELLERAGDQACRLLDTGDAALFHYPRALQAARDRMHLPVTDSRFRRLTLKQAAALQASGHLLSARQLLETSLASGEGDAAHQ